MYVHKIEDSPVSAFIAHQCVTDEGSAAAGGHRGSVRCGSHDESVRINGGTR